MTHLYGLTDAEAKVAERAAAIAKDVAGPAAAQVDAQGRFPKEAIGALAAQGFLGLCLPASHGGQGQSTRVFAAVVEEIAQACGSTAMVYVMHVSAAQSIAASTTLADKDALLREIAGGKHLSTLAWSERGSRSQFWLPMSKLEPDGDGFKTTARKSWVTAAGSADSYVSSAQMPGAKSPMESVVYLLRRKAAGVRVPAAFDGLGLRGNDSAPVDLESVRLRKGDFLGDSGGGFNVMLGALVPWFAAGTAAMAHGLCRAAVGATAAHLTAAGFESNGSKLRDLPNLRARLAEMSLRTEQSRALLGYALALLAKPDETVPLYFLQARLSGIQAALEVTDLAMKTCGGAAFSKHLPIERLFRDARAGWVMAPTADHLLEFIGRALTGLPLV